MFGNNVVCFHSFFVNNVVCCESLFGNNVVCFYLFFGNNVVCCHSLFGNNLVCFHKSFGKIVFYCKAKSKELKGLKLSFPNMPYKYYRPGLNFPGRIAVMYLFRIHGLNFVMLFCKMDKTIFCSISTWKTSNNLLDITICFRVKGFTHTPPKLT